MTEDEIAQKLAEKTQPVPEPTAEPAPEPEKPDENFHDNLPLENTILQQQLLDYFEIQSIQRHAPQIQQWVREVTEWARDEAKSSEFTDLLRVINAQELIMGNKLKPDRLMRFRQYIRINTARKKLMEQERSLYV